MKNTDASMGARDKPVEERADSGCASAGELRLSIIVVLHNSEVALSHSAPALAEEMRGIESLCRAEALFVDNASADDPTELVKRFLPQGRVIRLARNVGFGAGCNAGVREARGEYLFFVNPDVILDRGAVMGLMEVHKARADAWAVCGRMRNPDGSFQPTCRELPNRTNIFGARGSLVSVFFSRGRQDQKTEYTLPDYPIVTEVPATAATALMIRRETFDKLGGFDERFFMYLEDTDISAEIHARGGKIYFCPQVGGIHYWGAGSEASSLERSRWHHLSVWRYYRKRLPGFFSSVVMPLALTVNFLVTAVVNVFRKH